MKIHPDDFRAGRHVHLKKWPTRIKPLYESKDDYAQKLADGIARLDDLQQRLYASNKYALLVIFQAMDAAGKDGVIRHVLSGINPQGCQVFSFKHPSPGELAHDFLWRTTRDLPERGKIGVFNRSYYEEVLIARVHPEILRAENLPDAGTNVWDERFRSINSLERHLHANGTRVVKFFLHLSKEEQRQRFLARIDEPDKNWKFNAGDVEEREFWRDYMQAYEQAMSATSSKQSPWYIVPADDKENARLIVSQLIVKTLEGLKMSYPPTSTARRRALQAIRTRLVRKAR